MDNVLNTCPVTAVSFLNETTLLTGEASAVCLYSISNAKISDICSVFKRSVVHGICVSKTVGNNICVFGGRSLNILKITESGNLQLCTNELLFSDWIWAVSWIPVSKAASLQALLGCVLGHNEFLLYDWLTQTVKLQVFCDEHCILYSAKLLGNSTEDCVVASGTVFQEVLLWNPTHNYRDAESGILKSKVVHRLQGHKGVIFSIDYNEHVSLFASASDDRSIRLWKCSTSSLVPLQSTDFEHVATIFGHDARVWAIKILESQIVSIGEDATCRLWDFNGCQLAKFTGHHSKSIWSMAVNDDQTFAVSGAGDSGIQCYPLLKAEKQLLNDSNFKLVLSGNNEQGLVPCNVAMAISQNSISKANNLLVAMATGQIFAYSLFKSEQNCYQLEDVDCKTYSVIACSPESNYVAIGNIEGEIMMLKANQDDKNLFENSIPNRHKIYHGKIHSIIWLDEVALLTTGPDGKVDVWEYDSKELVRKYNFVLPYCKQRWITAGKFLHDLHILICGDRGGTVHIYDCDHSDTHEPCKSFWKIHGKEGVSDLIYHNNVLHSIGHDGTMSTYSITTREIAWLYKEKLHKDMNWLARFVVIQDQLLVLGFHSKNFCVFHPQYKQFLVSVNCGGGHRAWDFHIDTDTRYYSFTFIMRKEVCVHQGTIPPWQTVIKPGLHGHKIHQCVHIMSGLFGHILATASEDTTAKIVLLQPGDQSEKWTYKIIDTLQGHLSSVKSLSCVSVGQNKFNLFTGGGRSEINSWLLDFKVYGNNVHASHSLLHCTVSSKPTRAIRETSEDYRVMAMNVFEGHYNPQHMNDQQVYFTLAACSDGYIRLFASKLKKLTLIAKSEQYTNCFLATIHVTLGTKIYVLVTDTVGNIQVFDLTGITSAFMELEYDSNETNLSEDAVLLAAGQIITIHPPITILKVHQSGVNTIFTRPIKAELCLVTTGGDDGCVCLFPWQPPTTMKLANLNKQPLAHSSQVNGVWMPNDSRLLSTGIDQQLNVWAVDETNHISVLYSVYVNIADISSLCLWKHDDICYATCCGYGLAVNIVHKAV